MHAALADAAQADSANTGSGETMSKHGMTRSQIIARIWVLRDDGRSDHEIANELELSVVFVRRILAAGRRVVP